MYLLLNRDRVILDIVDKLTYTRVLTNGKKVRCDEKDATSILDSHGNLIKLSRSSTSYNYLDVEVVVKVPDSTACIPYHDKYIDKIVPNTDRIPVLEIMNDNLINAEITITELDLNQLITEQTMTDLDLRILEMELK